MSSTIVVESLSDDACRANVVNQLELIRDRLKSLRGPRGVVKLNHSPGDDVDVNVVSDSGDVFDLATESRPHPFVRTVVDLLSQSRRAANDDLGNFVGVLVCDFLVRVFRENLDRNVASACVGVLVEDGCELFDRFLLELSRPISFSNVEDLVAVARTLLRSKANSFALLFDGDVDELAPLLARAFVKTIDRTCLKPRDCVLVSEAKRELESKFELFDGLIVPEPDEVHIPCHSRELKVVIFGCALEETDLPANFRVLLGPDRVKTPNELVPPALNKLFEQILSRKPDVVVCQKRVDRGLKVALRRERISCLECLGTKRTRLLAAMTKADVVEDVLYVVANGVSDDFVGTLGGIRSFEAAGDEKYVELIEEKGGGGFVSTVLMSPGFASFDGKVQAAIEQCIDALTSALECPRLLSGGHFVEEAFAGKLESKRTMYRAQVCDSLGVSGDLNASRNVSAHADRVFGCLIRSLEQFTRVEDDGGCGVNDERDPFCPVDLLYPKLAAYKCVFDVIFTCLRFDVCVYEES